MKGLIRQNTSSDSSKSFDQSKRILFEPWSLGDALIAASVFIQKQENTYLVCQEKWHELIRLAIPEINPLSLVSIKLDYASSKTSQAESLKVKANFARGSAEVARSKELDGAKVFSIRGDFRDRAQARKVFPNSSICMNGWYSFFARRLPILDLPVKAGFLHVRNRYRAWWELLGQDFEVLERAMSVRRSNQQKSAISKKIGIHVGAQWRSKQFPFVQELSGELARLGYQPVILAGQGDFFPKGILPENIQIKMGSNLVDELKSCSMVVTNDSGPMHLSALLGTPTLALARTSNLLEWIPSGVHSLLSKKMPRGYGAVSGYQTDVVLSDWPEVREVVEKVEAIQAITNRGA